MNGDHRGSGEEQVAQMQDLIRPLLQHCRSGMTSAVTPVHQRPAPARLRASSGRAADGAISATPRLRALAAPPTSALQPLYAAKHRCVTSSTQCGADRQSGSATPAQLPNGASLGGSSSPARRDVCRRRIACSSPPGSRSFRHVTSCGGDGKSRQGQHGGQRPAQRRHSHLLKR